MGHSGDRVTWRLELTGAWGGRLDRSWLPTGDTEGWARIFEGEDLAGRVFAAGGGGLRWAQLAGAAAALTSVLEQYRLQWRVAEEAAVACPGRADAHLTAMAVPATLRPPRRSRPAGPWRVCELHDGTVVTVAAFGSPDLAEGAATAYRTGEPERVCWAEPLAARPEPAAVTGDGWLPRVDTDLRLAAFAAEDAVAALCAAASTGHTGPDVLNSRLLCRLGLAAHRMVLEYRTLFRAAWTDMEACEQADDHDADATARLDAVPDAGPAGPGGRWRHAVLVGGDAQLVSEHDGLAAAAASVAAGRGIDETNVRWAAPCAAVTR